MITDYEKLGQFYLGRVHDLQSGQTSPDDLVLYDSRDLTTHAVCVGMTGSGKTGLCLTLLEEAAIDGIPALCIDPKGDLGNLLLAFPKQRPEDFEPWIDPSEAQRQGLSVSELSKKTADTWKKGLSEWGQDGSRIQRFLDAADVSIYTPASSAGLPLTVLKSFAAPDSESQGDADAFRERLMSSVSGLLALLKIDADPVSSREHILLSAILEHAWRQGDDVDMAALIRAIQDPAFRQVGFLDLESFFPAAERFKLAMQLNNLLASPGFSAWLEGEPPDVARLLHTLTGKPRIAIISIAHLSDAERMFFVTILLNEVISWMRKQPGTSSLRALLYMDEVFGYFPPVANPPSKRPMLTLLKQARAYGLGCILATQNPVDLDYKGLSNCGTWFIGRLQTERDKLRVLEGLEGVAATTGTAFDRGGMEQILAGLGSRVFLMRNVHEQMPVIFSSRWALSYLRGPLTRQQIEILMAPRKANPASQLSSPSRFSLPESAGSKAAMRPVFPPGVTELFFPVGRRQAVDSMPDNSGIVLYPALLGQASAHYLDAKNDIDHWDEVTLIRMVDDLQDADSLPNEIWEAADEWDEQDLPDLSPRMDLSGAEFRSVPAPMLQKKSYTAWSRLLKDHVYRNHPLVLFNCPVLKAMSRPGESESDFRIRLRHAAREQRDLLVEKLRAKYASRFAALEDQIRRTAQRVEREKSQKSRRMMSVMTSIGSSVVAALFGRRLTTSRAESAIRSTSSLAQESQDIRHAEESWEAVIRKRDELNQLVEAEAQEIHDQFDADLMEIETVQVTARKSDLTVSRVVLVWLPYLVGASGRSERLF